MVSLRQQSGVLHMSMRNVVYQDEAKDARLIGHRCLTQNQVKSMVVDIRGCKPIDPETFLVLKGLFIEARELGVARFVRIGDGTLCAIQMNALEQEADICDRTLVFLDDTNLPSNNAA